jgi:hypothetical protein
MRLFFTVILGLLVGCGSSPESTDNSASNSDSSMATSDTTSSMPETASLNTLTDAEKSEGWQLLFDGQTKNGWHSYNKKGNLDDWKVENGTLVLNSTKKDDDIGYRPRNMKIIT